MANENKIENIGDHRALVCDECGCVKWAVLKSGKLECHDCKLIVLRNILTPVAVDEIEDRIRDFKVAAMIVRDENADCYKQCHEMLDRSANELSELLKQWGVDNG